MATLEPIAATTTDRAGGPTKAEGWGTDFCAAEGIYYRFVIDMSRGL